MYLYHKRRFLGLVLSFHDTSAFKVGWNFPDIQSRLDSAFGPNFSWMLSFGFHNGILRFRLLLLQKSFRATKDILKNEQVMWASHAFPPALSLLQKSSVEIFYINWVKCREGEMFAAAAISFQVLVRCLSPRCPILLLLTLMPRKGAPHL